MDNSKELVIITGVSGAGKSSAMAFMEDAGYYCIDNMPPELMSTFVGLLANNSEYYPKVAMVVDVRSGHVFEKIISSAVFIPKKTSFPKESSCFCFPQAVRKSVIKRIPERMTIFNFAFFIRILHVKAVYCHGKVRLFNAGSFFENISDKYDYTV